MTQSTTETTPTTSPIDLAEARAKIAAAKAEIAAAELTIATAELAAAEQAHATLSAECVEAQERFDIINKRCEDQHHVFLRVKTNRDGAKANLDTTQRNKPEAQWDSGGYRPKELRAWRSRIEELDAECKTTEATHTTAFAELSRLQGLRRQAAEALQSVSWKEGAERVALDSLKRKLSAMQPRDIQPPRPWQEAEQVDSVMVELSSGGLRPLPGVKPPSYFR
jgi:chromosome segregation ATPase